MYLFSNKTPTLSVSPADERAGVCICDQQQEPRGHQRSAQVSGHHPISAHGAGRSRGGRADEEQSQVSLK